MKKSLTVLQFCEYEAEFPGSLIDHFFVLSETLAKNKSSIVLSFTSYRPWMVELEKKGIKVEIIPLTGLFDYRTLKKLVNIVKKYKVDIIHTNFGKKTILYAILVKALVNHELKVIRHWRSTPPQILTKNMGEYITLNRRFKNFIGPIIWRCIYKFVDYNFVNAKVILDFIKNHQIINSNKVELLENSIDLQRFDPNKIKNSQKIFHFFDKKIITSIVNFRPEKDVRTLIQVAEQILKNNNNVLFVFAGDGPLRSELENFVQTRNLKNKIIFTGHISEMQNLIASSDIIILSNHAIGISNSHLEAMAMGKPVVSFNPGELENLIEDGINGYLVTPGDIQTFVNRINSLLENDILAKEIGMNAYKTIIKKYDIRKWALRIWDVYSKI